MRGPYTAVWGRLRASNEYRHNLPMPQWARSAGICRWCARSGKLPHEAFRAWSRQAMDALVSQGLPPFWITTEEGWIWAHQNLKELPTDLVELGAGVGNEWCVDQLAQKAQAIDPVAYKSARDLDYVIVDRDTALGRDWASPPY